MVSNPSPCGLTKLWLSLTPRIILALGVALQLALLAVKFLGVVDYGDQDIFQYIGWHLCQGGDLYTESWDSKGPIVFAVNAASVCLGMNVFRVFWTLLALTLLFLCYRAFRHACTDRLAAWGALTISIATTCMDAGGTGNRLEVIAALTMAAGLWLLLREKSFGEHLLHPFLQGILVALLVVTKASFVGYGLFLLIYWLLEELRTHQHRLYLQHLLCSASGFLLGLAACCLPFILRPGGMEAMFDAAVLYNLTEYNQGGTYASNLLGNLYKTWPSISITGLVLTVCVLLHSSRWKETPHATLITSACCWFIAELLLTSTVNTFFIQYMLPAVFPLTLLGLSLWAYCSPGRWLRITAILLALFLAGANLLRLARVQCHNLLNENKCNESGQLLTERGLGKKGAVLFGGASACRAALLSEVYATNKYTIGPLNVLQSCSAERTLDLVKDSCAAMEKPETAFILSEYELEHLPWYNQSPEFREAAREWEKSETLTYGKKAYRLHIYRRRQ